MIAYEELEKALLRWKARHGGAPAAEGPAAAATADVPSGLPDEPPSAPAGDGTGELELTDALVDEA